MPDSTAEQAGAVVRTIGRVGLVSYGLVHALIAVLAVQVALGSGSAPTRRVRCRPCC